MKHVRAYIRPLADMPAGKQRQALEAFACEQRLALTVYDPATDGPDARDWLIDAIAKDETLLVVRLEVLGRPPGKSKDGVGPARDFLLTVAELVRKSAGIVELESGATSEDDDWRERCERASLRVAKARRLSRKRAEMMARRGLTMKPSIVIPRWKEKGGARYADFKSQAAIWQSRKHLSWRDAQRAMDPELRRVSRRTLYGLFGARN